MPRRPAILIRDLQPGMIVPAHVHSCDQCGAMFLASVDARFCCNACRVAASRKNG